MTRNRHRRRGSVTVEWIVLFTLLMLGALAGLAALNYSILRQHDALRTSVEGLNFPGQALPVVISGSASFAAEPVP
jgi:hypothetical protein